MITLTHGSLFNSRVAVQVFPHYFESVISGGYNPSIYLLRVDQAFLAFIVMWIESLAFGTVGRVVWLGWIGRRWRRQIFKGCWQGLVKTVCQNLVK